jgi:serine/threonine protein kinase
LQPYQNTLVMFVEDFGGESLKIWMQQQKFSIEEFLRIAIATTESLQQIHSANIIHKDINPSNIVFNPAIDFLSNMRCSWALAKQGIGQTGHWKSTLYQFTMKVH